MKNGWVIKGEYFFYRARERNEVTIEKKGE
jgi:hypothetical protein